jgi:hypothetical protein
MHRNARRFTSKLDKTEHIKHGNLFLKKYFTLYYSCFVATVYPARTKLRHAIGWIPSQPHPGMLGEQTATATATAQPHQAAQSRQPTPARQQNAIA